MRVNVDIVGQVSRHKHAKNVFLLQSSHAVFQLLSRCVTQAAHADDTDVYSTPFHHQHVIQSGDKILIIWRIAHVDDSTTASNGHDLCLPIYPRDADPVIPNGADDSGDQSTMKACWIS